MEASSVPLLDSTVPRGLFATTRPPRDRIWAVLYAVALAGVVAGAVYAGVHRNPDFPTLISPSYLADADHCPAVGPHGRRLLLDDGGNVKPTYFLRAAGLCTGVSICGGVLLGMLSLLLFKHSALATVHTAVGIQIAIPAGIAVAAFLSGAPAAGVPFALMASALALTAWLYRTQLALVARLLKISVHALTDQPGIVAAALLLQLLGLLVLIPLGGVMLLGFTNGHVVPNPMRASISDAQCFGEDGNQVACCSWEVDSWVPVYLAYTAVITTWTTLLVFTIKMYTIAGATAQWYFAPAGVGAPKGALLRSTRHALGPSFGSLCLASWLLTLIRYARAALDRIRQDNESGFCALMLATCLDFLYALFEAITKFGVVRAAITGEAFMDACHGVVDLLARNTLDTVGVWFLPGFILQCTALVTSVAWGLVSYGASTAYWGGGPAAVASGAIVGLLSGVFALITLAFLNGVLLNMVDATYVAWAMDRDAAAVTRSDVHAVFGQEGAPWFKPPPPGAIVEQPDAAYAYAAEAGNAGLAPPPQQQAYPGVFRG